MILISFIFTIFVVVCSNICNVDVGAEGEERIVTNLTIIESPEGVPVDYTYNETGVGEELASAAGCPKSIDGFPWVYYGDPPKCHLAGLQGPCSENRLLYLEDMKSNHGVCVCEICQDYLITGAPIRTSPDGRYKFCGDDYVYDGQLKNCYDLHNQSSCEINQWLVKDSSGSSLTCVPECPKIAKAGKVVKYDYKTGKCVVMRPPNLERRAQAYGLNANKCFEKQRYSIFLKRCYTPSQIRYMGIG